MEDSSFTLKCNKCGNEIEIKGKNFYNGQFEHVIGTEPNIRLIIEYDFGCGCFECKCGNEIMF